MKAGDIEKWKCLNFLHHPLLSFLQISRFMLISIKPLGPQDLCQDSQLMGRKAYTVSACCEELSPTCLSKQLG